MIKVHFYTRFFLSSAFIMMLTRSRFCHAAIEVDGIVYESTFKGGVSSKSVFDCKKPTKTITMHDLPYKVKTKAFLLNSLGRPYDSKAIFSFMFKRNWEDKKSWFCSELVAMALMVGGYQHIKRDVSKISPGDLYKNLKSNL